jgi:cell filamentation protein
VFDPFGDFDERGYLRNHHASKNLNEVKRLEHGIFRANLPTALGHLRSIKGPIGYGHFLKVHEVLFEDLYPWAGKDRKHLGLKTFINKGPVQFESTDQIERAVQEALRTGNDAGAMRKKPGYVMGMLAWAHPMLDGNGRTMLLVHMELCHRAGFAIDWTRSSKDEYLAALTMELQDPHQGVLDAFMLARKRDRIDTQEWHQQLIDLPGLDGLDSMGESEMYSNEDQDAAARYKEVLARRTAPRPGG